MLVVEFVSAFLPYGRSSAGLGTLRVGSSSQSSYSALGPNASGKTSVNELLGHVLDSALPAGEASLSILLVATLRPRDVPSRVVAGSVRLSDGRLPEAVYMDVLYFSVYRRYGAFRSRS